MEVLLVGIIYTALYYVITLNTFFDGVDVETLKKNTFIKQEIFILVILATVFCAYIFISSQDILTGNMLTIGDENATEIIGAGKADVTIKLWGYRILTFVVAIAIVRLLKYIKKQSFKQSVISVLIVPVYMLGMFAVMVYFQTIYVGNNELDNEKEYIGYNIRNTKTAYGIDIDQQNIDSYSAITSEQAEEKSNVINNMPLISEDITLKAVAEHQENSVYYNYKNAFLANYKVDGKDKLMYITPREILNDSTISYNNRTLKYTHGYSVVASSTTDGDADGFAEYIVSDFTSEEKLKIKEPRIYFGLQTNSTIMVNTEFGKEYDYPITASKNEENIYEGKAGLNLGFLDRLVLAIDERNYKLVFSSNLKEETKLINNRNIIERAKKILPEILYDEDPYLVITDEGKLVWVIDGYTRSNAYPYSQISTINIKGYKEKINYIRNSVKVLVDAYDGTTKFYITDNTDPIIMTYRNAYPDLFVEEELPESIKQHLIYPKFLYDIQADMINKYHDISEDTLYRADDIWQITPKSVSSKTSSEKMQSYYTMLNTIDSKNDELGLFVTYNKYGKQNITSYLVGTVRNGKLNLGLYKFNSESNVVGMMQLNNQIEQDATITKQLEEINTSGTKLIKDMKIIPIDNTLLYVQPIYQVMLNEDSEIPVLKKVIVGSGNIAWVATAITSGGPGALFWMWVAAFLGMATKFAEITLGVHYRKFKKNKTGEDVVKGGPMYYLKDGLHSKFLAGFYALMAIFSYIIIAAVVDTNNIVNTINAKFNIPEIAIAIALVVIVGIVIFGGIKRLGKFSNYVVPIMGILYVVCGLVIIVTNYNLVADAFILVFKSAFKPMAAAGGFLGATVTQVIRYGLARGMYSNEAGLGTAAITQNATTVNNPVEQSIWGVTEVFLDTIIICLSIFFRISNNSLPA